MVKMAKKTHDDQVGIGEQRDISAEELLKNPEIRVAAEALQPKPGSGESITFSTSGPNGRSVTLADPLLGQEWAENDGIVYEVASGQISPEDALRRDVAALQAGSEQFAEGQQVIPVPEGQQGKLAEELSGVPLLTEALQGDHGALVNYRTMLSDQIKALDASIGKKEAEKRGLEFELMAVCGQIAINEKAASEHRAIIAGAEEEAGRIAVEEAAVKEAELDREEAPQEVAV